MFSTSQLIPNLEKNLIGKFAYFQKQLADMEVIDQESLLIINSNEVTDMFNIICCYGPVDRKQVDKAIRYFKNKRLPFAWWIGFENEPNHLTTMLEENGLKKSEEELAMSIQLEFALSYNVPANLTIKRVNDSTTIKDFVQVITQLVPHEQQPLENFFRKAKPIILSSNVINLYVGYIDSQPVSTCSVFFTEKTAGIFDIIASPKIRGMGVGTAMTKHAMNIAYDRGYANCILTATDDAKFLYEKIGFQPLKSMGVYS